MRGALATSLQRVLHLGGRLMHEHVWMYLERGSGELPKKNTPKPVWIEGHLAACKCGEKMFFPDDIKLKPVEIL